MGLNCFIILKEVMDGWEGHERVEQGAEGDRYLLLLIMFIKSDNKAITLAKDCVYTWFDFMSGSYYRGFGK